LVVVVDIGVPRALAINGLDAVLTLESVGGERWRRALAESVCLDIPPAEINRFATVAKEQLSGAIL